MSNDTIKKIEEYKSRLAALEQELYAELAQLPRRYGFANADEFIAAIRRSTGVKKGRKTAAAKPAKAGKPAKAAKGGRKARVKITPEIEAQVKELAEAGKTGAEIVKATGISLPSVQNLKKKLGLVKARGGAAA